MIRHRELSQILPALSQQNMFTMVVTSAVIPIPIEWMSLPRTRVAVSVDGLPEHHDERRKPATYDRILRNIRDRQVNIHWTITRPMLQRPGYLEEYVSFWSARPEVKRLWVSLYSPQQDEHSPEMLTRDDRQLVAEHLPGLRARYPKLLMSPGIAQTLLSPPANPAACVFSKMSTNYSADLKTRVEPCIFGGTPDCSQCGCAATSGLHYVEGVRILGGLRIGHVVRSSMAVGSFVNRFRARSAKPTRWGRGSAHMPREPQLVQIEPS